MHEHDETLAGKAPSIEAPTVRAAPARATAVCAVRSLVGGVEPVKPFQDDCITCVIQTVSGGPTPVIPHYLLG